ncbi:MAG: tagatose 6-phosphate kinase [Bacillota bacterium]|jgi:tagatose 6-phosphate kinase|nr:tagatose 6-phosphate kinase [Bacillota bacterium]MDK2854929.1 tagatose 6-phosphate kinase [Bacillota bacterium]MDK2924242.1 tagatose 6-phosphate kinase [Bacillota bacterium]
MILCVTLNAAVDKTYIVEGFRAGEIFRVKEVQVLPGGKGINVARAIRVLGGDVLATGFIGGHNGAFIEERLAAEGIPSDFVQIPAESRLTVSIIDPINSSETGLYEQGPAVCAEDWERFKEHFAVLLEKAEIAILSGSLPRGLAADAYAELIEMARGTGCSVILDTSGEALKTGLAAHPWLIKPNRSEAEGLLERPLEGVSAVVEGIKKLLADGQEAVAISLGKDGVIGGCGYGIWRVRAPQVHAASSVGAGDAFVAGFTLAWLRKGDFAEALRYGTACAAASVTRVGAGMLSPSDVEYLSRTIKAEKIT